MRPAPNALALLAMLSLSDAAEAFDVEKALRTTSLLVSGRYRTVRSGGGELGVELIATQVYLLAAPR